jgi:uncharacterized membrane protein YphA (DoxX/SURF4 family)
MASKSRGAAIGIWILTALLALLYLSAGASKLAGAQIHVEHFAGWGYPDWFRLVVGAIEVAGGIGLLMPNLAFYAASLLGLNMLGAAYTELFRGTPARAIFPFVLFCLLVLLASLRRRVAVGPSAPAIA